MSDLKKLKLSRANCKAAITRIQNFVEDPLKLVSATVDILEARKDKLITSFKQYESVQFDILCLDEGDTEDVGLFEEKYFVTIAKLNETVKTLTNSESSKSTCVTTSKLPTIDIPSYDGKDFTKFKPFYELFVAVIDNNTALNDVQKLFYLRRYLLEDALSVIVNLPLVSKSYKEALELLRKRYDNKTRLICSHINLILDITPVSKGTAISIRMFVSQIKQQLHALKNLDEPVDSWDRILLCLLLKKLDSYTQRAFHLDRNPEILPTMVEFLAFLDKRAMALEDTIPSKGHFENKSKTAMRVSNVSAQSNVLCVYCNKKDHAIFSCPKFKLVPIETRLTFVKDHKLCSICLRDHADNVCKYKFKCKVCKGPHNTLLHCENEELSVSHCSKNNISNINVLLPTVKVKVIDKYGREFFIRALLDSGSQASFVTRSLVNTLSISPISQVTNIIGIGNKATKLDQAVTLPIYSCFNIKTKLNVNCQVVDKITAPLPQQAIDISKLDIPPNLRLSDDEFHIPTEISLLLGADIYFNSILSGQLKLTSGPVLQNTIFGYVVAGKAFVKDYSCSNLVSSFAICDAEKLENVMEQFWHNECVPEPVKISDESKKAEAVFCDSVQIINNTFYVDMPLNCKMDELQLGDSFSVALQRFLSLERKLKQNPVLLKEYKKFINEYTV